MNQHLSIGDLVKVIDQDEPATEWAEFIVLFTQKDRFLLCTTDYKPTYEPFWIKSKQILVTTPSD